MSVGPAVRVRRPRHRWRRGTAVGHAAARQRGVEHRSRSPRGDPGSVAAVALRRQGRWIGRKVLIRTDSAGATHEVADWLTARHLSYSLGLTLAGDSVARIHIGQRIPLRPNTAFEDWLTVTLRRALEPRRPAPRPVSQPPPHPAAHTHPSRPGEGTASRTGRGRLAVPPLSRARSPCAGTPREVAGEPDRLEQRGQHADHLLDMRFEVHSRVQQMAALTEPGQRQRVHAVTVES
jgi:hypothetical protein